MPTIIVKPLTQSEISPNPPPNTPNTSPSGTEFVSISSETSGTEPHDRLEPILSLPTEPTTPASNMPSPNACSTASNPFEGFTGSPAKSERLQRLQLARRRLSLTPVHDSMREAYAVIEEYRRRGRARVLTSFRGNVNDLPSTEVVESTQADHTSIGPITRSRGIVANYPNVQNTILEYNLHKS